MNDESRTQQFDPEALVERLGLLAEALERHPDERAREMALELVQLVLNLHAEALRRMLATVESLPGREEALSRLTRDDVVHAVLLVHGLSPVGLAERVATSLDRLRPQLLAEGCDAELIGVESGRARLRLVRSGKGAPPVSVLARQLEEALFHSSPDLLGVDIDGLDERLEATARAAALLGSLAAPPRTDPEARPKLVQIRPPRPDPKAAVGPWVPVVRAVGFREGELQGVQFGDIDLHVCKVGDAFYAFRNRCPAGGRLDDARFESPFVTCACHGHRFDLRHRGACENRPDLRLEMLPVLVEAEKVKVALGPSGG